MKNRRVISLLLSAALVVSSVAAIFATAVGAEGLPDAASQAQVSTAEDAVQTPEPEAFSDEAPALSADSAPATAEDAAQPMTVVEFEDAVDDLVLSGTELTGKTEAELQQMEDQTLQLQADAKDFSAEDQALVADALTRLENLLAAVQDSLTVAAAGRNGTLSELEQSGNANSWRYQNGSDALPEVTTFSVPNVPSGSCQGVDVSYSQGNIDWQAVKDSGISFAIIRCGYGDNETAQDDTYWRTNADACTRLGIPFGVYLYSYATDLDHARSEAQHVLRLVSGYSPSLPIFLDLEENRIHNVGTEMIGQMAQTFCDIIQNAGYSVGIYASLSWWGNELSASNFNNSSWYHWIAHWSDACGYSGRYEAWQYASDGWVSGINTVVDRDLWYGSFSGTHQDTYTGLRQDSDGVWRYYENGSVATGYTGLFSYNDSWYYIKDGLLDWSYTGLVEYNGSWFYVQNGTLNWGYTGLAYNPVNSTWYYMQNSTLTWGYDGLAYNPINSTWYYLSNSTLNWGYNGLAYNKANSTWYYVQNSTLNWGYDGLAYNKANATWYYLKNSTLTWGYDGLAYNPANKTWYYLQNSTLNWGYTGLCYTPSTKEWHYVQNSTLVWHYNGLVYYNRAWYYVENSTLGWNYTGMVSYRGTWYYVRYSMLNWDQTGLVAVDDTTLWYYVEHSVQNTAYTGLIQHTDKKWYYVTDGFVDWSFNGTCQDSEGNFHTVINGIANT
jgi:GH25 family lysozyme M1 (1,4-beta-N-acetylmuramidase)